MTNIRYDDRAYLTYGSESTTNTYNAAGQRVKRFENGKTTKYYYSGSAILFTTDVNNFLQTENVLDLSGGIVASQRFDNDQNPTTPDPYAGDYFFYNYDCRGSTTAVIAPAGTLTTGYTYDEFGNQTRTGATDFLNEVTFTGSVSDTASGLQYMNARFYNPSTGRFLTQDSYSGNAYDPWTQHLYAYCGNNPVNMIDPTGHAWWHWVLAATVVVAAAAVVVGTAGGAAPVLLAVASVVNGCAATATTVTATTMVAAGVAVGGSVALGYSTLDALETSKTSQEFADQGESALVNTLIGGFWGGVQGYLLSRSSQARSTSENSGKAKVTQNKQSPKGTSSATKGWKVGDPIDNLTKAGNEPSWNTVRQRYWKNEAYYNTDNYSAENIARMRKGLSAQRYNDITGIMESMELHHKIPQRSKLSGINNYNNLKPVWPDEHELIDPYRKTGR